ncbi:MULTISPECIES: EamA family transporter [Acinetobacter]|uniref:EamA family transporter n=1 Tax=Acinetobacter TaxID=469 RepID=UPI00132FF004|nr:EamA family transporter [Acinetobacter johnsonii]MBO7704749.1 EamA family transporter [Acinetobacter sp.]MDH1240361.1 EamA family transporter [Acinetobacter johnsonii]MDH1725349.1 EamA family transporter [Acinetobacter johnsonii]
MPNLKSTPHLQATFLLLIAMLSLQSSGSLAKVLFDQFPILTVSAMRLLLGSIILAVLFKIWQVDFKQVKYKAILSYGFALAGMNLLFYLSIARLPLGIAVSFEFIGPLSVALFYAKQRFDFVWVGLAILGLVLLFPFDQAAQPLDPLGIAFALGAGACWALYIVAGQRPSGVSGNHTVCLGMFVGMLILMPLALFSGLPTNVFEPSNLIYFVALAVLASALPFSLEMIALRNLTALSFGTLMSLEPAIAALSGFVFLGEQLLWSQWLALSVIIMASIGCTYTAQKNRKAAV